MIKKSKVKGFTLIELLVVIAIIALLSSVVIASISKARQTAEIRKFEQELINIRTAIQLYREKHNGAWPTISTTSWTTFSSLLPELVAAGVYNKSTIDLPSELYSSGASPATFRGPKIAPNSPYVMSCGGPNHKDVYFVLNFRMKTPNHPNVTLPKTYYNGAIYGSSYYYCLEIR